MEDTVRITTREGIEDTIQTATRDRIEAFGQRITPEGIPIGSHPWESIYSGVKENAAILEKQVIQQEICIPNRYDSTYGIRATEQQFTQEGVETTLETASREGIEEMQEQAMREAAEAMESGRVSSKSGSSSVNDIVDIMKSGNMTADGRNIITQLDENTKVIFRMDVGENAHSMEMYGYSNPVNHINIEIQVKASSGKYKPKWNFHMILDNLGEVSDSFATGIWPKK